MAIFIVIFGAIIIIVLYRKEFESKKREVSQIGFNA